MIDIGVAYICVSPTIPFGDSYICGSPNKPRVQTYNATVKNKDIIQGMSKLCKTVPKVNDKYLSFGDIFNLYCSDIGKPHKLICLYQQSQLVDMEVLQWVTEVNRRTLPRCLGAIFSDFSIEGGDFICIQYEN